MKIHRPGYYLFDSKAHGTSDYMLLVNIDGQAVRVKATLKEESVEPGTPRTAETGEGIRYLFATDLRLRAGVHRVFIALPEDAVAVEKEITLKNGSDNVLRLDPVYRSAKKAGVRTSVYVSGEPNFATGIRGLVVLLNGRTL